MELTTYIDNGRVGLNVTILYSYVPSDPGVRYYRDGSGCSPTEAEITPYQIVLESVDFGDYIMDRSKIESGWLRFLEHYAWFVVDRAIMSGSSLWFDMLENAEKSEPDYD